MAAVRKDMKPPAPLDRQLNVLFVAAYLENQMSLKPLQGGGRRGRPFVADG